MQIIRLVNVFRWKCSQIEKTFIQKQIKYTRNFHSCLQLRNSEQFLCVFVKKDVLFNSTWALSKVDKTLKSKHCSSYSTTNSTRMKRMEIKSNQFRISDYDIIGFDLDGTLLRYNLEEMIPLEYDIMRRHLVEHKGYSRKLLDLPFDASFLQKGLVIDIEKGNILKLNENGKILRATHGTTLLTNEEIINIYGEARQWTVSNQFFSDPLSTWNGPLSEKLRTLLDYFDMAASLIFAQAIDVVDENSKEKGHNATSSYKVWPDILEVLLKMYTRENFSNNKSDYFNALKEQPDRYLLRTNEKVINWIKMIRASGKAVYLLTGSNIDFANFTATYALGKNWQELFDCVVCFARKPGYFTEYRPYLKVENLNEVPNSEIDITENLALNTIYSQGNWSQLKKALAKKVGKDLNDVQSLYLGDNLIQDVYTPVKHHDFDAVSICEELTVQNIDNTKHNYNYYDILSSSFWGSYFFLDNERTLWSSIITRYSKLCVPVIDMLAEVPLTHTFKLSNEPNFPNVPKK